MILNPSPCIDCEQSPQTSVFGGLFSSKLPTLDNATTHRYDGYQSESMNDVKQYSVFTEVYGQYKDKIYTFFYYRTAHNKELAEDLTSDTFVKAYEKFETYDDAYAMSTWLYRIARNTLIDHMRKSGRETFLEVEEEIQDTQALSFLDTIDQVIDIERVQALLGELPEKQERMIQMKYFEYKDTKEIAEVEDMQESAVRKNISRGIQKLQSLLALFVIFITSI